MIKTKRVYTLLCFIFQLTIVTKDKILSLTTLHNTVGKSIGWNAQNKTKVHRETVWKNTQQWGPNNAPAEQKNSAADVCVPLLVIIFSLWKWTWNFFLVWGSTLLYYQLFKRFFINSSTNLNWCMVHSLDMFRFSSDYK